MATTHIGPVLERRIRELNKKIDSKILRGKSYRQEAVEHRALLARLRRATRSSSFGGFFGQSFSFLSFL